MSQLAVYNLQMLCAMGIPWSTMRSAKEPVLVSRGRNLIVTQCILQVTSLNDNIAGNRCVAQWSLATVSVKFRLLLGRAWQSPSVNCDHVHFPCMTPSHAVPHTNETLSCVANFRWKNSQVCTARAMKASHWPYMHQVSSHRMLFFFSFSTMSILPLRFHPIAQISLILSDS